ncbi:MAG: hypothetical protein QXJ97_04885 [Desulfurococcaceae archaeon]
MLAHVLPEPVAVLNQVSNSIGAVLAHVLPEPVAVLNQVSNSIGAQILYYSSILTASIGTYSSALTSSIELVMVEPKATEALSRSAVEASIAFMMPSWSQQTSTDTPVLPSIAVAVSRVPVVRRTLEVRTTSVSLTEDSVAISLNLRVVDPATRSVDRSVSGVAEVLAKVDDEYVSLATVIIAGGTGSTRVYAPRSQNSVPLSVVLQSAYGGTTTSSSVCLTGTCPFSLIDVPSYAVEETSVEVEIPLPSETEGSGEAGGGLGGVVVDSYGLLLPAIAVIAITVALLVVSIRRCARW